VAHHDSKTAARQIFQETLAAIDIPAAIARWVAGSELFSSDSSSSGQSAEQFREIVAIAYGKASVAMAQGFQAAVGELVPVRGILVRPEMAEFSASLPGWEIFVGGHPIPNAQSFAAGQAILACLASCSENSLVVFLISGGGSSMVEAPLDASVSAEEFQALHAALVTCGAPIEEINVVRKHLSATKGGRLALAAPRARKITLAVSDVPGEFESALASGPTLPDPSTVAEAQGVVKHYGLLDRLPPSIRKMFVEQSLQETPKAGDGAFANAHFETLLGEHDLVHRSHHCCEAEGIFCMADDQTDGWPLEKTADELLGQLEAMQRDYPGKRVAILSGGELSSPVTGDGVGGRNSAFVLTCVPKIAGKKITVMSAGTDGIDGNSPAAGAVADGETLARAETAGMDWKKYMERSDAYNFFLKLDDAIVTGPTGNNLRDLRILISG
jgi:hydroxypyruvate reductase